MTTTLEVLQAEVLKLPPVDRSRLLEFLVARLDVDQEVEAAWEALADRREAEIHAGRAIPVSLEEVLGRLEARFPE